METGSVGHFALDILATVCGDMDAIEEGDTERRPWLESQAYHSLAGSPFCVVFI